MLRVKLCNAHWSKVLYPEMCYEDGFPYKTFNTLEELLEFFEKDGMHNILVRQERAGVTSYYMDWSDGDDQS